jgi:hypothetical protein
MHLLRALVDVSLGIEVSVIGSAGKAPIEEFHAADLNDSVLLFDFQPGGFRIEHDLAHLKGYRAANMRSIAMLAS